MEAAAAATPVFGTVARVDRDAAAQLDGYRRGRAEGHRDGLNEGRALAQQAVVGGLPGGYRAAEGAEDGDGPASGGHRRAQLEYAQHVQEAFRAAEVPDQEYRR